MIINSSGKENQWMQKTQSGWGARVCL